jgi:hypothetical protein
MIIVKVSTLPGSYVLSACLVLASCASDANKGDATPEYASSPRAAAVGFDRAIRDGGTVPFNCLPNGLPSAVFQEDEKVPPTVSVQRADSHWMVTLTFAPVGGGVTMFKYRVRHVHDGFCVDGMPGS